LYGGVSGWIDWQKRRYTSFERVLMVVIMSNNFSRLLPSTTVIDSAIDIAYADDDELRTIHYPSDTLSFG